MVKLYRLYSDLRDHITAPATYSLFRLQTLKFVLTKAFHIQVISLCSSRTLFLCYNKLKKWIPKNISHSSYDLTPSLIKLRSCKRIFLKKFLFWKCCRRLWQPVIWYQKVISFDWVGHTPAITFAVASG